MKPILTADQIKELFPFHVLINKNLEILQTGKLVDKLMATYLIDKPLLKHFTIQGIAGKPTFDTFLKNCNRLIYLESIKGNIILKGAFYESANPRQLIFIGNIQPVHLLKYHKNKITLKDIPVYDSFNDFLFSHRANIKAFEELELLLRITFDEVRLTKRLKKELEIANKDLERKVRKRTHELEKTNKELEESEKKYRNLIEITQDGIVEVDNDETMLFVNKQFCKMVGYKAREILGKSTLDVFLFEEDRELVRQIMRDRIKGISSQYETKIRKKDGSIIHLSVSGSPTYDEHGKVIGSFGILNNITERKKAEEALKQSEEKYRGLVETMREGILHTDSNDVIRFANSMFCVMTGYSKKELIGQNASELLLTEQKYKDIIKKNFALRKKGLSNRSELKIRSKSGEVKWILHSGSPLYDKKGKVIGSMGVAIDITEHKKAEEALKQSEERFREMTETIQEVFWLTDWENNKVLHISPAYETVFGETCQSLYDDSKSWSKHIHPDYKDKIVEAYTKNATKGTYEVEYPLIHPKGRTVWVQETAFPIKDKKGKVIRMAGYSVDITKRKRAEVKLEENTAILLQTHTELKQSLEQEQQTSLLNEVSYNIAKASNKMVLDIEYLSKIIHLEVGSVIDAKNLYIALYDSTSNTISFPYAADVYLLEDDKEMAYKKREFADGFTEQIITSKKPLLIAGKKIREFISKQRIKKIYGKKPLCWLGVPLKYEGRVMGVLAVQSYTDANAYGKKEMEFLTYVSGQIARILEKQQMMDELKRSEEHYRSLSENATDLVLVLDHRGTINYVSQSVKKICGYSPFELTGRSIFDFMPAEHKNEATVYFKSRITIPGIGEPKEFQMLHKNGSVRTIEATGNNMMIEGKEKQLIINARDITLRVKTEKELQERNRELDTFVYKASHDLKGPLASIRGVLNLAKKDIKDENALKYLDLISKSTTHLNKILTELLEISTITQGTVQLQLLDIEKMVHEIVESLRHTPYAKNVRFKLDFCEKKKIYSDRKLLTSVIQNLVDNAMKYKNQSVKHPFVSVKVSEYEKGMKIKVNDNGQGIPDSIGKQVFEMFFRGNDDIEGTGLGLYIASKAIEKLGGKIEMSSKEKKGTEFIIYLPN